MCVQYKVCKIDKLSPDIVIPKYATNYASGMDIVSPEKVVLLPHIVTKLKTGFKAMCPPHHEFQIRSRSGLASNGIFVINSPGTIDADYRGEICILLMNTNDTPFVVEAGMRIAQMVLCPISECIWEEGSLDDTERGRADLAIQDYSNCGTSANQRDTSINEFKPLYTYLKDNGIFTYQEAIAAFEYPDRLAEMKYMELQYKYNTLLQKLRFIKDIVND